MPLGRGAHVTTETLARREKVAAFYLQSWTQARIGLELGITQQTVSNDLHAIRLIWRESLIRNFDDARAQELAKIDRVEVEYWEAWERSQKPGETTHTEQDSSGKTKASLRKVGQVGDSRFLDGVMKCIERRCALLGIDAPQQFRVNWDTLTDAQLARLAAGDPVQRVLAEA